MFRCLQILIFSVLLVACGDNNSSRDELPKNDEPPKNFDQPLNSKTNQEILDAFNKLPRERPVHCFYGQYWDQLLRKCVEYPRPEVSGTRPKRPPDTADLESLLGPSQAFQCEVGFSVDVRGSTYNIVPHCLDNSLNDEVKKAIAQLGFPPPKFWAKAAERPLMDCCLAGKAGTESEDVFFCTLELPEDASVCEMALNATQD